jgi:hypothetical protein
MGHKKKLSDEIAKRQTLEKKLSDTLNAKEILSIECEKFLLFYKELNQLLF